MPAGRFRFRRVVLGGTLLLAAAYVVWDRIEARRLDRDIAAIAARGEPVTIDERPRQLTPAQRQAARVYATAVERMREETADQTFRYLTLDIDNPASAPPPLVDLEARYRNDAPSLQLLDQATPLDFSAFADVAPELDRNQEPLAGLGTLNDLRADLFSMRGKGDEAAGALVGSVRLMRAIPLSYYRYRSSARFLGSVRVMLRHTMSSAESLERLQHAFEAVPDPDLAREVMASRALFIDALNRPPPTPGDAVIARVVRPLSTREWRRQLGIFEQVLAVVGVPWPDRLDRAAVFQRDAAAAIEARQSGSFLRRLIPYLGPAGGTASMPAAASDVAARRVVVVALAVARYRRANGLAFPPALESLVPAYLPTVPTDPFSGKPILYRSVPGGWRVYSVDRNRTDDGGVFYGIGSRGQLAPRIGLPHDMGIDLPALARPPAVRE